MGRRMIPFRSQTMNAGGKQKQQQRCSFDESISKLIESQARASFVTGFELQHYVASTCTTRTLCCLTKDDCYSWNKLVKRKIE